MKWMNGLYALGAMLLSVHSWTQEVVVMVADWDVREVVRYEGSYENRVYEDREIQEEDILDFDLKVEVLNKTDTSYTLGSQRRIHGLINPSEAYHLSSYLMDLTVMSQTTATGDFARIENREYLLQKVELAFKDALGFLGDVEFLEDFWQEKLASFKSSEDLDIALADELYMLLYMNGNEFEIGEVWEYDTYLPGFNVVENIPAKGTIKCKSMEGSIVKLQMDVEIDKTAIGDLIEDIVDDLAGTVEGVEVPEEFRKELRKAVRAMTINRRAHYDFDTSMGWVTDYRDRVTVSLDGMKEVNLTKLVMVTE